jgi:ABC-type transport system involved in cytochrome c biogenesis ATPase subunit
MLSALIEEHLAQGGMTILTSHQTMPMANGKVVKL